MSCGSVQSVFWATIGAAVFWASLLFGQPVVEKCEPPNWWTGMQSRDVQLLLYGANLQDAVATSASSRIRVQQTESSASGKYCFVDITVGANLESTAAELIVENRLGREKISFPVHKREPAAIHGGQQGVGPADVIYLITPDRFANGNRQNDRTMVDEFDRNEPAKRHGGDLQGVIEKLDYLADLGITTIWLNPVLENRGINSYHGYKTTDFYRIDPRLGTNSDYQRLVAAAHERGLKVIFDHVSNHVGLEHPWIKNRPQGDWFNGSKAKHLRNKHFLYSLSDPHGAKKTRDELERFWFVDRMPDLNQRNRRLSKYLIQNAIWWIEHAKLDGIREDTYPYADQGHMKRFVAALEKEFPHFNLVGEVWALEPAYIAQYQKGSPLANRSMGEGLIDDRAFGHLPSLMDFPLMDVYRRFILGEASLNDIYERFAVDFVYGDPMQLVTFIENHDTQRAFFIANRNTSRIKIALQLLLTTRGIPQLLYGSEVNMFGGPRHVDLRADFVGGFAGDDRDAFTADGRTDSENDAFNYLRQLLHLRKKYRSLSAGTFRHFPPVHNVYIYTKSLDDEMILGVVNGSEQSRAVDLAERSMEFPIGTRLVDLRTGEQQNAEVKIELSPLEPRIFQVVP
ncbi:alpha-amylase family glycosyl hydrolase [Planctomycetota bacterium]